MRIKLEKVTEFEDGLINEQMDRQHQAFHDLQGDQVGPFDHPDGIAADTAFPVAHDLGEIPGSFAVEDPGFTGKGVYATQADREVWTDELIYLRSPDTTNRHIVIRVRRSFDG